MPPLNEIIIPLLWLKKYLLPITKGLKMIKRASLLSVCIILLISCYPMGTFQGPDVLPQGQESAGIGLSWMTNIISLEDSSSGSEDAFFADGSIMLRRGFAHNTEIGFKLTRGSNIGLALMSDVKWQFLNGPVNVAVDLGVSYWSIDGRGWVGYHPSLLTGTDKLFVVAQHNHIRSPVRVTNTQDLLLGRHIKQEKSVYTLTPFVGIHRSDAARDNVYYSLGFGFKQPIDKWSIVGR